MLVLGFLVFTILGTAVTETPVAPNTRTCPRRCKPTCAIPNPRNCAPNPACQTCQDGYILQNSFSNNCIPIYECPQNTGCNGDRNAYIQAPVIACPPTCCKPNQHDCTEPFLAVGCMCKPGYIFSRRNGRCIPIRKCPGGNPCPANETFVTCTDCIFNRCPDGDDMVYPCDPRWPCPAGCVCADGYRSYNGQCILSSDCPPVGTSYGEYY